MSENARSNKLVFYNFLSTILLYAITFISAPLFSRCLGKENYGIVQVYNTWISFFTVITGLYTRGTLAIARSHMPDEEQKPYQSSVLCMSFLGFAVISFFVIALNKIIVPIFGLNLFFLVVMLLHSFGTYCIYFLNSKNTYEFKARNNLIISVAMAAASLILSLVIINCFTDDKSYAGRILGIAIPYIIGGAAASTVVFYQGKTGYSKKYWKFCAPLCFPLILHGISGIICSASDRIMISKMIDNDNVGIYSLAYNFCDVMNSIWGALHNSWDPFFYEYLKKGELDKLKEKSRNYTRLFTCLTAGFILLSPEVYRIFASKEYWDGIIIIPIIVLSIYFIFIYSFAANYEFYMKRTDVVSTGSAVAGIVNIILNFILIPIIGYLGAAIATLLSNIVLMFIHFIFAKILAKEQWVYNIKFFIPYLSYTMASAALFYVCHDLWIVRWIIAGITGIYMVYKVWKKKSIF